MSVYLSEAMLLSWADPQTVADGRRIFARGGVADCRLDDDPITATVSHLGAAVRTRFQIRPDGHVDSQCPCRATRERGTICSHVTAAGFWVADQTEDPVRERRMRIAQRRKHGSHLDGFVQRQPAGRDGGIPARLRIRLSESWRAELERGDTTITLHAQYRDDRRRLDRVSPQLPLSFDERDAHRLYVLEDMADQPGTPGTLALSREGFVELLEECAPGEFAVLNEVEPLTVSDDPHLALLTVAFDPRTGLVHVHKAIDADVDQYLIGRRRGWVLAGHTLRPLEAMLPGWLRDACTPAGATIPRERAPSFVRDELPRLEASFLVDHNLDDIAFEFRDAEPEFEVECVGTSERLEFRLWAVYGERRVRTDRDDERDAAYPVPNEPLAFFKRNREAERAAAERLRESGGHTVDGPENVMKTLADTVPALRRDGWRVAVGGPLASLCGESGWVRPVVTLARAATAGWFDAAVTYVDDRGRSVPPTAVEEALAHKSPAVHADGRALLIDSAVFDALRTIRGECFADGDKRVSDVYAGNVTATLDDHPEIRLDADDAWWAQAKRQTGKIDLEPVDLDGDLQTILRPYQREGVNWLRFLERGGYGGILADEMGLGKTLQALAWIQLERVSEAAQGLPALVVCPTSLVDNWAREAARFTPHLKCHVVQGADRHAHWDELATHDLVITSYALLRRDIDRYHDRPFAIAVLDEAQHIKNRSTQNARGAKRIRAFHRLVLTGTPMENGVADLWSIIDFLMPKYLGAAVPFREAYERPIARGGDEADNALRKLRHKIEPFMLRRMKAQVAKDLPEKVERIATCALDETQARRYRALAAHYHDSLADLVGAKGFRQARFTVLKTLLRLRQLCCHPALLKEDGVDESAPSAKLDLFFELLAEAIDGGHRVLVFSQFVEMLRILRRQLDERAIPFAYLDGATRERQAEIDRFNDDETIPVFLVSLKAGGTGLNLTGANVVIHFDPWWNPAVEDQATDRVHRIGQTRSVYSIKLITRNTIEEKVLELQARKRQAIAAAVGGESTMVASLSWEDVRELLAL